MKRGGWIAAALVAGWYLLAIAILHPLGDTPVVDSWLYRHAVLHFLRTGAIRFAGYTQAMPVGQVLYASAWGAIFGASHVSLKLADAVLGAGGAYALYALARRCGAGEWQSIAAASLIVCNPCYMFLSFSFMTDVPFVAAFVFAHLAFARAEGDRELRWRWISAVLATIAFLIRPFGAATIAGCSIAILISRPYTMRSAMAKLAPFAIASIVCAADWIWLTVLRTPPWSLQSNQAHLAWLGMIGAAYYLRVGVLNPLLYLGTVTSPLAVWMLATARRRQTAGVAVGLFGATIVLASLDRALPVTPEYSCFGGWRNVLILQGLPNRFFWEHEASRWLLAGLGSVGAAGLITAAIDVLPRLSRGAIALMIATAIYWCATLPLWMFNDRYYLVMLPAACIVLALAPLELPSPARVAAFAMTAAMGLLSIGGTYSYQRGLSVVAEARDALTRQGVPRATIDAGYPLNGEDLYRYPDHGIDTMASEAGIPMITSQAIGEYTIAAAPMPGTRIVRIVKWPGPFGLAERDIYVLKKSKPIRRDEAKGPQTPS